MSNSESAKFARGAWLRALERTAFIEREPHMTLPRVIERLAALHPTAPALSAPGEALSFGELAARAAQYARLGLATGLARGEVVALLLENSADYVAIWLGLTRIGVTVALINTHLTGDALAQSIRVAEPRRVLIGASLTAVYGEIKTRLPPSLTSWELAALMPQLLEQSGEPLPETLCPLPELSEIALYIYTSGTTGYPKAARVSHLRIMQWTQWFAGLLDIKPNDRMYDCLPLYHSIGGVVAIGATLVGGGSVVIRTRFSASEFWRDIRKERCTLFQYIGELCRYLVNAPPDINDGEHSLRLACGNGLRPEVWGEFERRFKVPRILEYYAATEANFSLYNCEGEPGAIGRIPPYLSGRQPVALLRIDGETGEPRRNALGFCERCGVDEPGEAVCPISGTDAGGGRFEGYQDPEATARKVLTGVFRDNDTWYRSGDLMRRDARGFYYFVDRLGDTFRWKGENVSTADVLSVISRSRGVLEGVVYGVAVPGTEGRAGMAALTVSADFDLGQLYVDLAAGLPGYARPLFLRLLPALDTTGTLRPVKRDLQESGYDPRRIREPLYFDARDQGRFVPIDAALYAELTNGRLRL